MRWRKCTPFHDPLHRGARLRVGGARVERPSSFSTSRPRWTTCTPKALLREEIFGPIPFHDADEAERIANAIRLTPLKAAEFWTAFA